MRKSAAVVLILALALMFVGCGDKVEESRDATTGTTVSVETQTEDAQQDAGPDVSEHGVYDSRDEVAEYIVAFGKLPENYITKKEARKLGWDGGTVEKYAPGKCIGGDSFGNYEGNLPSDDYRECDIDTLGKDSRGAERLVYSDGAIYYTKDHYKTFEKVCDR